MDRRFFLWLALSFLIMIVWQTWVVPPPKRAPPNAPPEAAAPDQNRGEEAADRFVDGAEPADARNADARHDPEIDNSQQSSNGLIDDAVANDSNAVSDRAPAEADGDKPAAPFPTQFVTLGSLGSDSPFRMLVTLTSSGASVRRIELASARYLELDDRSGYAGHLELQVDGQEGLLVRAVGAGTPSAAAGLRVGDRILSVHAGASRTAASDKLTTVVQWNKLLRALRPGQSLHVQTSRDAQTLDLTITLTRRPLETVRPESENVLLREDKLPADFIEPASFLTTLQRIDGQVLGEIADAAGQEDQASHVPEELPGVRLRHENWELTAQSAASARFQRKLTQWGLVLVKTYTLEEAPREKIGDPDFPAYDLTLELSVENTGDQAHKVAYQQDGPNGLPVEGWWYAQKVGRSSNVGLRDMVGRYYGAAAQQVGAAVIARDKAEDFQGGSMAWAGVDAQYFSVIMLPLKKDGASRWLERVEPILLANGPPPRSADDRFANITCRLISEPESLQPGEKLRHAYRIFSGPKRPELLAHYKAADHDGDPASYTLGDLVYYGWFGSIATIMLSVLHFFYDLVGNYGLAIIMLTVLVRGCMFPISRGQAKSMAKMQQLRPEMERLKEKYKGDQQKYAQAMQDLYRKHGVNPLAGCLPMVIQLPVFIGLYRCLAVDVELRQAPLLGSAVRWCSNLAAPDMFLDWTALMPDSVNRGQGFFGLGPYLNILPLVTIALFLLQQKLFMPPPTNEQGELQQKLMKYMMVVMGLLFYKVPSGLCLYFIASSLWGIAERKLIPAPTAPAAAPLEASTFAPRREKTKSKGKRKR